MRNVGIVLSTAILLISLSGYALAVPQYYLFNGSVRSIGGDNVEIAADQGFKQGKEVEYLFMVDSYVMGQVIYTNGQTEYDPLNIFAELVAGSILDEVNGGYYIDDRVTPSHSNISAFLGQELHLANVDDENQKEILVGNEDRNILINSNPDGSWNGYLQAYDSTGRKATVFLDLKLTSVTNEIPFRYNQAGMTLPEPVLMILLGTGLLGIASLICKRRKRSHAHGGIPVSEH